MSEARKQRRQKAKLKAADEAVATTARLQAQVASGIAEIDRLQKIEKAAHNLQHEHKKLMLVQHELNAKYDEQATAIADATLALQESTHELRNTKQCIIELRHKLEDRDAEIASLKTEDKDSAKLRLRLKQAKKEIAEKNTMLCKLRAERDGFDS